MTAADLITAYTLRQGFPSAPFEIKDMVVTLQQFGHPISHASINRAVKILSHNHLTKIGGNKVAGFIYIMLDCDYVSRQLCRSKRVKRKKKTKISKVQNNHDKLKYMLICGRW